MNYTVTFKEAYKGKKIFLTGHTGFKGAWMLAWLHQLGARVKGYALAPYYEKSLYDLIDGEKLCESVIADIRDEERLKKEILDFQPDFIFHFAAQPLVRRSYDEPVYTFGVNVMGTAHVLEAARNLTNFCAVIIITTDKVYENKEQNYHYKETDRLGGHDPYSASKACTEIVASSYRNSFFNPIHFAEHKKTMATARAGNVIGGGDRSMDRIIPDIIKGLEKNETIIIRNPSSVRPWQFVLEPLSGYLLLGSKLYKEPTRYCKAWNFGPDNDDVLTVKEVVEQALQVWGHGNYSTPILAKQPHEAGLLKLDISKTIQKLGWKPKLHSKDAISHTMNWYKKVIKENASAYTIEQIHFYQEL
ncbi:MAG: CDP-glucose 4,6-dehydratase [Bacteroidetes bacterium]|nr:CDP-glucose 4,6-dehydratase [Bacteroidota bacterium]